MSGTLRLVIAADNSLIVEAIRIGLRTSGEFNVVGYADLSRTSSRTIICADPDIVLIDDMNRSARVLELIREISNEAEEISLIMLATEISPDWLEKAFEAGAIGVISKAAHPNALATLVRETVADHIFHRFSRPHEPNGNGLSSHSSNPSPLTERELDILKLVAGGLTNGEVARDLWITEQTVKFHLRNIYRKLDVANRTQASHFAYSSGLVGTRGEIATRMQISTNGFGKIESRPPVRPPSET